MLLSELCQQLLIRKNSHAYFYLSETQSEADEVLLTLASIFSLDSNWVEVTERHLEFSQNVEIR